MPANLPSLPIPQPANAAEADTLREMIAFHRALALGMVADFDDARTGGLAREIHATHCRYAETLQMLLSFLE